MIAPAGSVRARSRSTLAWRAREAVPSSVSVSIARARLSWSSRSRPSRRRARAVPPVARATAGSGGVSGASASATSARAASQLLPRGRIAAKAAVGEPQGSDLDRAQPRGLLTRPDRDLGGASAHVADGDGLRLPRCTGQRSDEAELGFLLFAERSNAQSRRVLERGDQVAPVVRVAPRGRDDDLDPGRPELACASYLLACRLGGAFDLLAGQSPETLDVLAEQRAAPFLAYSGQAGRAGLRDEEPQRVGADIDHRDSHLRDSAARAGRQPERACDLSD